MLLSGLYLSDNAVLKTPLPGSIFEIVFSTVMMDLFSRLKNHSIAVSLDAGLGEICSFHSSLLITLTVVFLVSPPFFKH